MGLGLVVLFIINFGISWFNAYSCGRSWADSKAIGGWLRFMVWCGAVMSACGFTWCYLVVIGLVAGSAGWLPPDAVKAFFELGYVIIIFPILGSGLCITLDSITTAWRQRDMASVGTAAWNTFAQVHNTYEAARGLPSIFEDLGDFFKGGSGKNDAQAKLVLLVVLLALLALAGGALTTAAIINHTAGGYARALRPERRAAA